MCHGSVIYWPHRLESSQPNLLQVEASARCAIHLLIPGTGEGVRDNQLSARRVFTKLPTLPTHTGYMTLMK